MAEDVTISRRILKEYIVGECNFSLEDERANKAIENAGELSLSVLVDTSIFCKEYINKGLQIPLYEEIGLIDRNRQLLGKNIINELKLSDSIKRICNFKRIFFEKMLIDEKHSNHIGIEYTESSFKIDDGNKIRNQVMVNKQINLDVNEAFNRRAIFKRQYAEIINLVEKLSKENILIKCENTGISDNFLRNANAVFSNLIISAEELAFDEFIKLAARAPEYDSFVDFNAGEYEYQKALVRFILESKAAQAEPIIHDVVCHVDIEDTDDRGSKEIVDMINPTKIYFNKLYYHPPEVNITLKGSSGSNSYIVPRIVFITEKYFEVELRNESNQLVQGLVSWVSKGY